MKSRFASQDLVGASSAATGTAGRQKPIRHRAGALPSWLQKGSDGKGPQDQDAPVSSTKELKYVGVTGDGTAVVLDTDQGKQAVKLRPQELNEEHEEILDDQIFQQREEDQPQIIEELGTNAGKKSQEKG